MQAVHAHVVPRKREGLTEGGTHRRVLDVRFARVAGGRAASAAAIAPVAAAVPMRQGRRGLPPMRSRKRRLRRLDFLVEALVPAPARSSLAGLSAYCRRAHGEPGFARRSAPTNAAGGTKMPHGPLTNSLPLR